MKYLAVLLLLAACSASGPMYQPIKADGQIVVYRPIGWQGKAYRAYIDINGGTACKLAEGGYYIINGYHDPIIISSSVFGMPGTSRITVKPDPKKATYLKIELSDGRGIANIAGGLAAGAAYEAAADTSGPYIFTVMPDDHELQGMHQDCM